VTAIGIHQPNFMPWLGYFKKIYQSEKFIFLDSVKCSKNSYLNRNKFSTSKKFNDYFWLSCPLKKDSYKKNILEVNVDSRFIKKHMNYFKMRHSKTREKEFLQEIIKLYDSFSDYKNFSISHFNIKLIKLACNFLDIKTQFMLSSKINENNKNSKQLLLIDLIKIAEGTSYISGNGAKDYQDENMFLSENIELIYIENKIQETYQIKKENVSMIDLMLHLGINECKKMILA
jgi:hypothetical protein